MFFLTSKLIAGKNLITIKKTSLPAKEDFCCELTLEHISDKDYEHAQKLFKGYCQA